MQVHNLKLKWLFFAAAFSFLSPLARAEEAEFDLEPVIVTAVRYDEIEDRPDRFKVDERKLSAANYDSALDVIREMPGVTVTSRGASSGMNAYSQILLNGSDRYVVVIDGVRSNWNGGGYNDFDFSVLPAELLDSVEILPASAGAVYGNAAKGGVIQITTKSGTEGVKTSAGVETGSYGREREFVSHRGKNGGWSWSVYGQKSTAGDYSSAEHRIESHENTENIAAEIRKSWESSELVLNYSDFGGRYTSKIFNFKREPQPDGALKKVKNIFMVDGRKKENTMALKYNRKISDTEKNEFGVYRRRSEASYDDSPHVDKPWLLHLKTEGFFDRYEKRWHPKNTLIGGLEYYQEQVLDFQDLVSSYSDKKVISKAVYVQNEWRLDDKTKVTGSLRQDSHSYAGSKLSPAVALEYEPVEQVLCSLSFTEYFAPPKQVQLFAPYGNTALLPEEGQVYALGAVYRPDHSLTFKANIFYRDAKNVIGHYFLAPFDTKYANLARETAAGFTISAEKRLSEYWRFSVSYTQTKVSTEKREHTAALGLDLPHGELLCNLMYDKDKYSAVLQGRGVFDQANGRGEGLYANNTYWVWNASLNYKINPNAKFYFKVNNIFDQFYSSWNNDTEGFLGFDEWYAEPGRHYQVGLSYTF